MTADVFESGIRKLYNTFGRKADPKQIDEYWGSCRDFSDKHFQNAVETLKHERETFPSLAALRRAIFDAQNRDWQENKAQETEQAKRFFQDERYTGVSHSAMVLINARIAGKMDSYRLAELMEEEDRLKPGIGWKREANELRKALDRRIENKCSTSAN